MSKHMWQFLYALGSPKRFFNLSRSFVWGFGLLSAVCLLLGCLWGLFWAPADYQQGDAFRVIYLHVPAAFLSLFIYTFCSFLAVLILVWQIKLAGIVLKNALVLGAWMTALTLITGAIWGKPMWGTWWIWDARLTSELLLLFIYFGLLATLQAIPRFDKAIKVVAILTLIGLVDLPIIHYSVYWWNTLHQGQTLSLFAKPKIAMSMLYPLLLMLVGFIAYFIAMVLYRTRHDLLWFERKTHWVRQLMGEQDVK